MTEEKRLRLAELLLQGLTVDEAQELTTLLIEEREEWYLKKQNEVNKFALGDVMRSFSIGDLRKAFEDAKRGGIEKVPVLIDQYGSVNIEEHYVANLYKTFEDWYEKNYTQ